MHRTASNLPAALYLALVIGCMGPPAEYVNMVDFPPDSCGKRWRPAHLFSDPQAIALAIAVERGDTRAIDRLIASGADVNARGRDGVTPLAWSLMVENKTAYRRLLEKDAAPNHPVWGKLPLIHVAAEMADPEWLQLALEHGGDANIANRFDGIPNGRQTPIYRAINSRQQRNIELLIAAGADLNYQDDAGDTPLLYGRVQEGYEVAYKLLQAGADFRTKNKQGWDLACDTIVFRPAASPKDDVWQWREKIIGFLEEHGADFEAAERQIAKDNPQALAVWKEDKQQRANRQKNSGG